MPSDGQDAPSEKGAADVEMAAEVASEPTEGKGPLAAKVVIIFSGHEPFIGDFLIKRSIHRGFSS